MRLAAVISFVLILNFVLSGQNSKNSISKIDTIDIKKMVQAEIERVKNKELMPVKESLKAVTLKKNAEETSKPDTKNADSSAIVSSKNEEFLSTGSYIKLSILVLASVAAVLYIVIRRRKLKAATKDTSQLKKNVMKLRDDKVDIKNDEELIKVRQNLQHAVPNNKLDEESLSAQAKKLSVSKGELSLAAKLKSFRRIKNARTNK